MIKNNNNEVHQQLQGLLQQLQQVIQQLPPDQQQEYVRYLQEDFQIDGKVEITTVSMHFLLHDLTDCITTCPQKIAKRLRRLRRVCILMGIDPDAYIRGLVIPEEVNAHATDEEILNFMRSNQHEEYYGYEPIVYEKDRVLNDTVKKLIESELTSGLNADGELYKLTCRNISRPLYNHLLSHGVLGDLLRSGDLIMVHKGGVAYYHLLIDSFPDQAEDIKRDFGYGGDNDISCMLNPDLPNYDSYHKLLVNVIWNFLIKQSKRFGEGSAINKHSKNLKTIKVGGITMSVQPAERKSFEICDNGDVMIQNNSVSMQPVYTSKNDLKFKDTIGRLCMFTLVRARRALFVTPIYDDAKGPIKDIAGRVFSSELIDIACPRKKEDKYRLTFHHYKSGQWVRKTTI